MNCAQLSSEVKNQYPFFQEFIYFIIVNFNCSNKRKQIEKNAGNARIRITFQGADTNYLYYLFIIFVKIVNVFYIVQEKKSKKYKKQMDSLNIILSVLPNFISHHLFPVNVPLFCSLSRIWFNCTRIPWWVL